MRSRSRQSSRLTFHPIVIASAVVFVILFLALGYHTGVSHEEQVYQPRLDKIKVELDGQRGALSHCNAEKTKLTSESAKSNSTIKALRAAVEGRHKEQKEEQDMYKAQEAENAKCDLDRIDVKARIAAVNAQDEQNRLEVEEVAKEVDSLLVSIQQITHGDGMSIVLLSETVKRLREAYTTRCRSLPGCVELSDADLLQLRVESNETEEELRKFLERDAAAQKDLANSLQGPSANLSGIYFLPTVDEERQWDAKSHYPTYFKRSIAMKPLRGVKGNVATVSASGSVVEVVETYGDYAMCAYRYKSPKFSFQSSFAYASPMQPAAIGTAVQPVTALLHELIVSPLLQYCIQCDAHMWTPHYRLACFKNRMRTARNYGTRDFWAVRSMIQAAPTVQREALNFYEKQNMEKQRVLAVVLHLATEKDRAECDRAVVQEYGIHYQYLMANFPNETSLRMHVAEEHQAQCSPTPAQIIEQIQHVRKTAAHNFDKIYLSVSTDTRSNVLALLSEGGDAELRDLLLDAYSNGQGEASKPGLTELVDLEIASRATDILVSPFLPASRYVTEEFLLRHKLNPSGKIWVF